MIESPATVTRAIIGASTSGTNVLSRPGRLVGWLLQNTNAAVRYVKIYDKATTPTVGTDTPKLTIAVPPASAVCVMPVSGAGIGFAFGIGYGVTTGQADNDTTAPTASETVIHLFTV